MVVLSRVVGQKCYCVTCEGVKALASSMAAELKSLGMKEGEDGEDQTARAQKLIRDKLSEASIATFLREDAMAKVGLLCRVANQPRWISPFSPPSGLH